MAVTATKHEMSIIDESGDTKVLWDSDRPDEVAAAKRTFDDLKSKGYSGFRVSKKGDRGEIMQTFDPDAEAIVMTPQMRGG